MANLADKGAAVACAAGVGRGALWLGRVAGPSVGLVVRAGSLWLALRLRGAAVSGRIAAAALVFAALARRVGKGPESWARGVTIVKPLARVSVSAARALNGPGQSVGEVVQVLPVALRDYPLPVGRIGRKLAALAVARGETMAVVGNTLTIGGRVLIEASGSDAFIEVSGAARVMRALSLEAGHIGEGVALAVGSVRDTWLSERRIEAAAFVKKNVKAALKTEDQARRAALLADLRYMELRA